MKNYILKSNENVFENQLKIKIITDSPKAMIAGDIVAINVVLQLPPNESSKILVI